MGDVKSSRIIGGNTAYKRRESDFYPTPPEATQALLDFLELPHEGKNNTMIWEPAAGEGDLVRVLALNGYKVTYSDIRTTGHDFLNTRLAYFDRIITNPPFSLAEEFIERCFELGKPFALLLKSQFWHAKRRLPLFEKHPPHFVLPLTWRPDFLDKTRGKGNPLMDVIWVVWDAEPYYPTIYQPLRKPKRYPDKSGLSWVEENH